jgi:hypothetical protein
MVTNPATRSAVAQHRNYQKENALRAVKACENMKQMKYIKSYGEQIRPHFHPFCLEATGAYGTRAAAVLKQLAVDQSTNRVVPEIQDARSWFLKQIAIICARARAQLILHARSIITQDVVPPIEPINYPNYTLQEYSWPPLPLFNDQEIEVN